jgi:hypothetical protein
MNTWGDPAARPEGQDRNTIRRARRAGLDTIPDVPGARRPRMPSTQGQHKRITELLAAEGVTDRHGRLAYCSAVLGRPVPAYAAMSVIDATIVLLSIGIDRGLGPSPARIAGRHSALRPFL